jgi:histone chaperone ASF1
MSVVSLLGVKILNNPAKFTDSYEFEITFECLEQLQKGKKALLVGGGEGIRRSPDTCPDLEWKLTYVGSATS